MKLEEKIGVFVVEDEPVVLAGYVAILKDAGYEIIGTSSNGAEAIEEIIRLKDKIGVVIVDINIPAVDGISVVERINSVKMIPCIVVTGYRDENLIARAKKERVFSYLQKPVDRFDLISAISISQKRFNEYKSVQDDADTAKNALKDRKLIEKAKGILMEELGISESKAMVLMQKKSRDKNKKLVEIAKQIIGVAQSMDL